MFAPAGSPVRIRSAPVPARPDPPDQIVTHPAVFRVDRKIEADRVREMQGNVRPRAGAPVVPAATQPTAPDPQAARRASPVERQDRFSAPPGRPPVGRAASVPGNEPYHPSWKRALPFRGNRNPVRASVPPDQNRIFRCNPPPNSWPPPPLVA